MHIRNVPISGGVRRHDEGMQGRLWMLTGAPGAGKTALRDTLRDLVAEVVVVDMDDFIDQASVLAGVDLHDERARPKWPAYNALCLALLASVLDSGVDCLLMSPLSPADVRASPQRLLLPSKLEWAVLDCTDDARRERLRARKLSAQAIDDVLADARELRAAIDVKIESSGELAVTAALILDWIVNTR